MKQILFANALKQASWGGQEEFIHASRELRHSKARHMLLPGVFLDMAPVSVSAVQEVRSGSPFGFVFADMFLSSHFS